MIYPLNTTRRNVLVSSIAVGSVALTGRTVADDDGVSELNKIDDRINKLIEEHGEIVDVGIKRYHDDELVIDTGGPEPNRTEGSGNSAIGTAEYEFDDGHVIDVFINNNPNNKTTFRIDNDVFKVGLDENEENIIKKEINSEKEQMREMRKEKADERAEENGDDQ